MRSLILGSLSKDTKQTKIIKDCFNKARSILNQDQIILNIELIFINQYQLDDIHQIEYARHDNHIEFFIGQQKPPIQKDILAAILKATIEYQINQTRAADFDNQLLFDLYRLGLGLYYANRHQANWNHTLSKSQLAFLSNKALTDKTYDQDFWLWGDQQFPLFVIWYFGQEIIRNFDQQDINRLLKLTEDQLKRQLQSFV